MTSSTWMTWWNVFVPFVFGALGGVLLGHAIATSRKAQAQLKAADLVLANAHLQLRRLQMLTELLEREVRKVVTP